MSTQTTRALEALAGALDDGTRWTTCSCPNEDGPHVDPKTAERAHRSEEFAGIIARNTGRHVVLLSELAVDA